MSQGFGPAEGTMALGESVGKYRTAQKEQRAVQEAQARQRASRERAFQAATQDPRLIAQLDRGVQFQKVANDKLIQFADRNIELAKSTDPTLKAAAAEALKLVQGEESRTLAPVRNERARQKKALVAKLRQRLGPGAESSSAGIEALNRFDEQTSNVLAGQQQASLGTLLGTTLQARQPLAGQTSNIFQTLGSIQAQQVGAEQGRVRGGVEALLGSNVSEFAEVPFIDPQGKAFTETTRSQRNIGRQEKQGGNRAVSEYFGGGGGKG